MIADGQLELLASNLKVFDKLPESIIHTLIEAGFADQAMNHYSDFLAEDLPRLRDEKNRPVPINVDREIIDKLISTKQAGRITGGRTKMFTVDMELVKLLIETGQADMFERMIGECGDHLAWEMRAEFD